MPSSEVVGPPTEADSKPIVAPGAEAQAQESEVPPERQSGRLTAKDFTILTDCSVCRLPKVTAAWVWKKETLVDTDGIIQDSEVAAAAATHAHLRGVLRGRHSRWRYADG